MQLQRIIIHNIASITDAEIDFTSSPLSDSPVFLISGKTGAGKSTILDCICLALYADTPRMKGNRIQGRSDENLSLKDTRQLLRRNTGEGACTLFFRGSNSHDYKAVWSVQRARKKPAGNLQSKQWTLEDLTAKRIYTKDNEISSEITNNAVGLDFTQFCRTSLLAQGEFTRFLNSDDREKAEILEKITGVDIYSRISARLYSMTQEKANAYREAERNLNNIAILSDERTAILQAEIKSLSEALESTRRKRSETERCLNWILEEKKLSDKLAEASAAAEKSLSLAQSDEIKAKQQLIDRWDATIDVRSALKNLAAARHSLSVSRNAIHDLRPDFALLLCEAERKRKEIDDLVKSADKISQLLKTEEPFEPLFNNTQTILGHIELMIKSEKKALGILKEADSSEKKLTTTLKPVRDEAERILAETIKQRDEAERERKSLADTLAEMNLPALQQEKEQLTAKVHNVGLADTRLDVLVDSFDRYRKRQQQADDMQKTVNATEKVSAQLDKAAETSRKDSEEKEKTLQRQRDSVDKFAAALRSRLTAGDCCPVCGRKIEGELPHEDELEALCRVAQEAFDTASQKAKDDRELADTQRLKLSILRQELNRLRNELQTDRSCDTAMSEAVKACREAGVTDIGSIDVTNIAALRTSLESIRTKCAGRLETLAPLLDRAARLAQKRDRLTEAITQLQKKTDASADRLKMAENDIAGQSEIIAKGRSNAQSLQTTAAEARNSYLTFVKHLDWSVSPSAEPAAFGRMLKERADRYSEAVNTHNKLQFNILTDNTELKTLTEIIVKIKATLPAWADVNPQASEPSDKKKKALTLLSEVEAHVADISRYTSQAEKSVAEIDAFIAANPSFSFEELERLNALTSESKTLLANEIEQVKSQAATTAALQRAATENLRTHRLARPVMKTDTNADLLTATLEEISAAEQQQLERQAAVKATLAADSENRVRYERELKSLADLRSVKESWEELCSIFGSQDGTRFRRIAQSYILSALIDSANIYMNRLSDRYTLSVKPGSFVIYLTDAYQDYSVRTASTISGGESFLVSLALALALSDIRQRLSVDTLFIDEGFGSLSGQPLAAAVNTLRSLHTTAGRRVGIISHVEELRECIPTQIRLEQQPNSSFSTIEIASI